MSGAPTVLEARVGRRGPWSELERGSEAQCLAAARALALVVHHQEGFPSSQPEGIQARLLPSRQRVSLEPGFAPRPGLTGLLAACTAAEIGESAGPRRADVPSALRELTVVSSGAPLHRQVGYLLPDGSGLIRHDAPASPRGLRLLLAATGRLPDGAERRARAERADAELRTRQGLVSHVAVRVGEDVVRLPWPARHFHIMAVLEQVGIPRVAAGDTGFCVGPRGPFLTRDEAARHASEVGQFLVEPLNGNLLFSGNLW